MPLHPVIARHLKIWYRQEMHLVSKQPIEQARKKLMPLAPIPEHLHVQYQDFMVDGDFIVRLYQPKEVPPSPSPLVIFIRASGYTIGTPDHYNIPCATLAQKYGYPVAGIHHRLSPEYKYPVPLNDCERAVTWLHQKASHLDLDQDNFILWGECSGANLSASLCHRLAAKEQLIKKHIMLYPVLANHLMTHSKQSLGQGYMTDMALLDFTLKHYLEEESQRNLKDVSPILNDEFANMPPTAISVGEYDPFKDEAQMYADKFKLSNPNIELTIHPGLIHGFIQYYGIVDEVNQIIDRHIAMTE